MDIYEYEARHGSDNTFVKLAKESIVSLTFRNSLGEPDEDGVYRNYDKSTLVDSDKCEDARFATQVSFGFCSGTLVDSTHIATAGHCITAIPCSEMVIVFNYYVTGRDANGEWAYQTIREEDVYSCKNYLSQDNFQDDYGLVELDREVLLSTGHKPAQLESGRVFRSQEEQLVVIGFGSGLPMKIDDGGVVTNTDYKDAGKIVMVSHDTFGGNSGSGVFDMNGVMIGIHVRGSQDYVWEERNGESCQVPNHGGENWQADEQDTYLYALFRDRCYSDHDCGLDEYCGNLLGGIGQCAKLVNTNYDDVPTCPRDGRPATCCNYAYESCGTLSERQNRDWNEALWYTFDEWCCDGLPFCSYNAQYSFFRAVETEGATDLLTCPGANSVLTAHFRTEDTCIEVTYVDDGRSNCRTDITNYQVGPCPDVFDMVCTDSDMVTQEQTSLSESMQALGCDPAVEVKCCSGDCTEEDDGPWAALFECVDGDESCIETCEAPPMDCEDANAYLNSCMAGCEDCVKEGFIDMMCAIEECPAEARVGDSCARYSDGLSCDLGEECCCGVCHPSMHIVCEDGIWLGFFTDACMMPCQEETSEPDDPCTEYSEDCSACNAFKGDEGYEICLFHKSEGCKIAENFSDWSDPNLVLDNASCPQPVCPEVTCIMDCENGYVQDKNGCDTCECDEDTNDEVEVCPEGCVTWFDGCNTCGCDAGEISFCTLMFCFNNEEPYCMTYEDDGNAIPQATQQPVPACACSKEDEYYCLGSNDGSCEACPATTYTLRSIFASPCGDCYISDNVEELTSSSINSCLTKCRYDVSTQYGQQYDSDHDACQPVTPCTDDSECPHNFFCNTASRGESYCFYCSYLEVDGNLPRSTRCEPFDVEGQSNSCKARCFLNPTYNPTMHPKDYTEWCPDSAEQLCRMQCSDPACSEGQCALRDGTCCDYTCIENPTEFLRSSMDFKNATSNQNRLRCHSFRACLGNPNPSKHNSLE